jgi:hypothetical protein
MNWVVWDPNPGRGKRFSLLQNIQTDYVVQPDSYSMGTGVLSWEKVANHDAHHSPASTAKGKNEWRNTPFVLSQQRPGYGLKIGNTKTIQRISLV